ncbi:aminotransferase class I/II-fold pyridoxal phosphate-dependent enzyme [Candidatus Peregrinibacteria bacterium]|nr:aminotransferase class I/II-fold pyridoxal phosphate-dependent enzyme [Candidatus Peregrinibacteria bacterium]MBI3816269.1 aminotransferase class I/II-fold pyridoxal phosphate-dependent enzyme [Candidatus Peregrinibacteria bacterium]
MSLFHPIHHTFAPLADAKQRRRALALSYLPWRYKRGPYEEKLRTALEEKFHAKAFLFSTGREALFAFLRSIPANPGDEVIVQGYTCVVVPNAIHGAGLTPIYCDIERDTLNLDCDALEMLITPKTRAIICQHTFGIPADAKRLREICDRTGILLIEDCAHVIPDEAGPKEIGEFGDALLLSFGRDKAISGITGGAIVSRVASANATLERIWKHAHDLSFFTILRLLEYPNIYGWAKLFYGLGMGKLSLVLHAKIGALRPILTTQEKHGRMKRTLHRMPDVCAALALEQLGRLPELNDHRRMLTKFFCEEGRKRNWPMLQGICHGWFDGEMVAKQERSSLRDISGNRLRTIQPSTHPTIFPPLQKFPLFTKGAETIRRALKSRNIHLHDGWTSCVVCPASVNLPDTGYELGNDPAAEAVCEDILSLPTHPTMTMRQAEELVESLDPLLQKEDHIE